MDAARVHPGTAVRISLDAFRGQHFTGRVSRIAPYVRELEKQARTVDVEVRFDQPPADLALLTGYSADVEILLEQHTGALRIPTETLLEGQRVLRYDPSARVLREVQVQTGLSNWRWTEGACRAGRGRTHSRQPRAGRAQGYRGGDPCGCRGDREMIRLRGGSRSFQLGEQQVMGLDGLDLDIAAGDYMAVMGPSGSGKSTLLNILGLLDAPSAGEYWLQGEATASLSEARRAQLRSRLIGFVFQSYHLIARLTVLENIELPMVLAGIGAAQRRKRSSQLVARLGLGERIAHRPAELSGGQRQRVAIARAMVMQPALLLADEPTGNLDSQAGAEVFSLLEELNGEGLTLIVVTHDASLGARAQRQLHMRDGRIHSIAPQWARA